MLVICWCVCDEILPSLNKSVNEALVSELSRYR